MIGPEQSIYLHIGASAYLGTKKITTSCEGKIRRHLKKTVLSCSNAYVRIRYLRSQRKEPHPWTLEKGTTTYLPYIPGFKHHRGLSTRH